MRKLPMTESEIRMRYRDGTSVQILADLNACTVSMIKEMLGTEQQRIHPDKPAAPKPKQIRNHDIDWGRAKELYDTGMIDREIAVVIGCASSTVALWRNRNGYPANCSKKEAGRRSQRSPKREFPKAPIVADPVKEDALPVPKENIPKPEKIIATDPECIISVPYDAVNQMVVNHLASAIRDYPGKKATGKPRLSLVPPEIIEAVGRVRTYGTEKYGSPDNWLHVDPELFKDALMRHMCEYLRDPESIDEESGLPHLEHIACNVAFLLALPERRNQS